MANEQNLKPIKKGELSKEEAKKRGSNGGKKSAQARAEKRLIRERILERMGEADWDEMVDGLISRAKETDKGFELLRDTIGQKPTEKLEVSGLDEQKAKLDELLEQRKQRNAGK